MDRQDADALARVVESASRQTVRVRADGEDFAVDVLTASGNFTLRDESEWGWLRNRIGALRPLVEVIANDDQKPTSWRWRCSCGEGAGGRWSRSLEEANKAVGRHQARCPLLVPAEPPAGYLEPTNIYLVELTDDAGDECFGQLGGFRTESEARKLISRVEGEGRAVQLNIVAVWDRWEDYEFDR